MGPQADDVRRSVLYAVKRTMRIAAVTLLVACTGDSGTDGAPGYELQLEPRFVDGQEFGSNEAFLKLVIQPPEGTVTIVPLGEGGSGSRFELLEQPVLPVGTRVGLLAETGAGAQDRWNPIETLAYGQVTLAADLSQGEATTLELLVPRVGELGRLGTLNTNKHRMLGALAVVPGGAAYVFGGVEHGDALSINSNPKDTILKLVDHDAGDFAMNAVAEKMPEGVAAEVRGSPFNDTVEEPIFGRVANTATVIDTVNGPRVLVTGGRADFFSSIYDTDQAFLFDPVTETVQLPLLEMDQRRSEHLAIPFPNGEDVLIAGGFVNGGEPFTETFEVYDASAARFEVGDAVAPLFYGSFALAGAPLGDNRVLVCGGCNSAGTTRTPTANCTSFRANGTATEAAPLNIPLAGLAMAPLPDGGVLAVGGFTESYVDPNPPAEYGFAPAVANAYRFDPGTETWIEVGSLNTARAHHRAVPLPSGDVLVIGGSANGTGLFGATDPPVNCPELYDAGNRQFVALPCDNAGQGAYPLVAAWPGEHVIAIEGYLNSGNTYGSGGAYGIVGVGPDLTP